MANITVLGAGTWGTALAAMLEKNKENTVKLWSAFESELEFFRKEHTHPKLENFLFPESLITEADIKKALCGAEIVVFAVPSPYLRKTVEVSADFIEKDTVIVDVAKGFEAGTQKTLSEVIEDVLGNSRGGIVALSGPTHAEEVALCLPTAIVAASRNEEAAIKIQRVFSNDFFRVYTNSDIKGIEICGAMKNIIAIAAGISLGLGFGDNSKAAIITRGMAEIARLGVAMGASEKTVGSLAGIGDLVVTCTSAHSRNQRAGYLIGKGMTPAEAVAKVDMAVEGLNALPAAIELSEIYGVDLPICKALDRVIKGEISPEGALVELMSRELKSEV